MPNTQRIVDILKLSEESQKGNTFETKISEFEKTFEDANDYLKFLQTLERSIKDLSSDDLAVIEHSIPGIFHNLKIIWMISKHKDPNKFGFLLEVMAKEIWTKISEKVQLKALFKTNPDEIDASIQLITQANKVANEWNSKYSDTKNKTKWEYAHNKITKDLEIYDGMGYEFKELKEYKKYYGRLVVQFKNNSQNTIRMANTVLDDCEIYEILPEIFVLTVKRKKLKQLAS